MNKKMFFLVILFLPFFINAEEKCEIISGNGQDIGSEIACGEENFYIIENKEETVRMLSKYNLEIGYDYNKVTISEERYNEIKELCEGASYCDLMFDENEFKGYSYVQLHYVNDDNSHTYMIYKTIENESVKQSSKAIGAHGDEKGKPEFPEYAVVSGFPMFNQVSNLIEEDVYEGYFIDFLTNDINFYADMREFDSSFYLSNYKEELLKKSYNILNIDLITVNELSEIVYKIGGERLPLKDWGENNWDVVDDKEHDIEYYILGSIKEYIPQGYEWLYSTTYWTKTALPYGLDSGSFSDDTADIYFVDTLGNLCNAYACWISVGAGIRPVVEITKDSINYNLITESEEGGTLEKVNETKVGDTIVLKPLAKAGYKLKGFTITTDSGQTIEIEEKDIFKNDDGTIIINPDVFVMPLENVIITARWGFTNPKTGVFDYISFIMVGMLICAIGYISINQYNRRFEL